MAPGQVGPGLADYSGSVCNYSENSLFDASGADREPSDVARAHVARVAIANSDAAWDPYAHAAIAEAHRAVSELLR